MPEDPFLLVSLQEDKAKKLAQVISNPTARKILDILTKGDATESEISEKLSIPISTVHYNLQLLVEGNLVVTEEFHYSKKGREILHYKLANKYIIIAPSESYNLKDKLRKILPLGIFALIVSGILQIFTTQPKKMFFASESLDAVGASPALREAAIGTAQDNAIHIAQNAPVPEKIAEAAPVVLEKAVDGASAGISQLNALAADSASGIIENVSNITTKAVSTMAPPSFPSNSPIPSPVELIHSTPQFSIALWFLFGALFSLVVYLIWDYIHFRRKR